MKQHVIDVVIPAHEKDVDTLNFCIEGIRKNVKDVRRIIVVSKEKYTDKAEWFSENSYPFSFKEIAEIVGGNVGWNFQQLLKLYSVLVIPDISENVLVVDSDTVFFRKVEFFSENGLPLYNLSKDQDLDKSPFHQMTFRHIARIFPEIAEKLPKNFKNVSGICHHMLFQKHMIAELFKRVEEIDGTGDPFYKVFLKNSENSSGVAEYNLYFYFLVSLHPNQYQIRILRYKNTADLSLWKYRLRPKYHYCSFHAYMRENQKNWAQKLKQKILRLFYFENWQVGVLNCPIHDVLKSNPDISWIKTNDKINFLADPFGFEIADKKYLVFEDYLQLQKRGRIALAELNDDMTLGARKIILDDCKHLSYPFIFNHQGKIFMLCESYKAQKLSLYEIDQKELVAKKIRDIFTDKKVIDPTIIFFQNKFWLFYSSGDSYDSKLFIAYADSLFDEFKDHPKNPVKIDLTCARSAGTPFMFNGELYRPAQNCYESYGSAISINRIVVLNEENFQEDFVREIKPDSKIFDCEGLHTLSALGNITLIDGKRRVFAPYKPLISLLRNILRIFK